MNLPHIWPRLFTLIALTSPCLAQVSPEVREFRSKAGSRLKAMIVGVDDVGRVLLQRYAPTAVPLESLSEEDRAYVRAWQERQEKEQAWIREGRLNEQYQDPGLAILKDTLRTLEDDKWKPYAPENVDNLQLIAYYFTQEHPDDRFINLLSDAYVKLRRRTDVIEVVYVTLGNSEKAVRDYVKSKEFRFPVLDPAATGLLRTDVVGTLFKGSYPQLVVVDRKATVKADSSRGQDDPSQLTETLEQMKKLARAAARAPKSGQPQSEE